MKANVEIAPYGALRSALKPRRDSVRVSKYFQTPTEGQWRVFISFSRDLDESFVQLFRNATQNTRLLIVNEGTSTDRLLSRIFDLQIRTPERCCIVEASFGSGKT